MFGIPGQTPRREQLRKPRKYTWSHHPTSIPLFLVSPEGAPLTIRVKRTRTSRCHLQMHLQGGQDEGEMTAPPANVSLTRTGRVADLDIDDHREGTSIHFHDPARLVIIVHERPGGDTDPEVNRSWSRNGYHSRHASSHTTRHSTPANVEDLAALLYEMRENQDERYRKTDDRPAHLEGDRNARRRRGRVSTGADNDSESGAGQFDLDAEDVTVARGNTLLLAVKCRGNSSPEVERKNDTTGNSRGVPDFGLRDNRE
ncbi:hypothetical protein M405DRAFT_844988 [Rhizopogon salebrosus TDB-379]|nr:hypothetical protein M405DRAFT_844988 [Rhizopogon salebrosus TDB-379]